MERSHASSSFNAVARWLLVCGAGLFMGRLALNSPCQDGTGWHHKIVKDGEVCIDDV